MTKDEELIVVLAFYEAGVPFDKALRALERLHKHGEPSSHPLYWMKYNPRWFSIPAGVRVEVWNNDATTTQGLAENIDWTKVYSYRILPKAPHD
jgi:hypothetical protein